MQQQKQRVSDFLKTCFLLNFCIFFFLWKQYFIPYSTIFQCFNVASIGSAISLRSFDVSHKRCWECNIITTPNSSSISVFFFSTESDFLYLLGPWLNIKMWPVLVLQFHCNVLMFHPEGDGECMIIWAPNSYSIGLFFFSPESDFLYLLRLCFNIKMWPVLVLQFHFEVLMFHSARDGGVYQYFNTQFWLNFGVLFFHTKR